MSEHTHGHGGHEHEPWRENLAHAFKELKEADDDRDTRLRRNQEAIQKIFREVFPPVLEQFKQEAKKHGFEAEGTQQKNGTHVVTLNGPSSCTIEFHPNVTPEVAKLNALRHGTSPVDLLQNKKPDEFREADLANYLADQLLAIRPKKQ